MDQGRKMLNQDIFIRQRIKKASEQLRRLQQENKRRELEVFMFQCISGAVTLDSFNLRDSAEMGWVINQTLRNINAKMMEVKMQTDQRPCQAAPPPPPPQEHLEKLKIEKEQTEEILKAKDESL